MYVDATDGRIYLPMQLREKFGSSFELVDRGDRLVLVPVADDPLEALRDEARGTDKSVDKLKKSALEDALDESES